MKSLSAHTVHQSLKGRRVVISGGTSGLGKAMALRLTAEGAAVLVFGRHQAELDEAMTDLRRNAEDVIGLVADSSRAEDMERVFQAVDDNLGGLDVLIANAAVGGGSLTGTSDADREYALSVNISGYLRCAKLAMARMKENAHIIFIGSIMADHRTPGGSVYVATKCAIQGFAESFRQEAAESGVKVTLIEPGKTMSGMITEPMSEQLKSLKNLEMLKAEDLAVCVEYVLTQPPRCNIATIQLMPTRVPAK